MTKVVKLTCAHDTCSKRFEWTPGRGGRPKYCRAHRAKRNRARDLRKIQAQQGAERAAEVAAEIGYTPPGPAAGQSERWKAERLAIFLGVVDDPLEAAELAGIPADDPKAIRALAKRARKDFAALSALTGPALLRLAHQNVALLLLELRAATGSSDPQRAAMIAAAAKSAQQIATQIGGGAKHSVPMAVVFGGRTFGSTSDV